MDNIIIFSLKNYNQSMYLPVVYPLNQGLRTTNLTCSNIYFRDVNIIIQPNKFFIHCV